MKREYTYIYIHTYIYIYTHLYIYVYIHVYHTHMNVHIQPCSVHSICTYIYVYILMIHVMGMGWLRLYIFYRALLQKRPIILRRILIVATPYPWHESSIYICAYIDDSCHGYGVATISILLEIISLSQKSPIKATISCQRDL